MLPTLQKVGRACFPLIHKDKKLAVKSNGKKYDAAIKVDNTPVASGGPLRKYKLTNLNDEFVEVFSPLQANCGLLSFNVWSNIPDERFDAVYEVKTVDRSWQQAPLEEKEFFACWPVASAPVDPTQIQALKLVADITTHPHLFGRGDIPGLECHQVWLYLTYYGFNYNIKKSDSESNNSGNEACDNKSEFELFEEPLDDLKNEGSESDSSRTDQVLTPQEPGGDNRSQLGEDVDPYADTPLLDQLDDQDDIGVTDLKNPSIIEEDLEDAAKYTPLLEKAASYER
ncbi:hypothetical protein TWF506_001079 [Arthrobotrys conoides]|uniref:Uncharacterized protein n=1 Tax=Arthrobotrys conoides TaxID=74498 RepID=A0AAN8P957_9PEZI